MSSADSTELGYVSDVNPDTESEKLPASDDDDYETETEDEKSEGVQSETSDEYERAINRYAELLADVPQDKFGGIVETIEDLLTGKIEYSDQKVDDGMENILFALFITFLIITASVILGCIFESKTNLPFLI
jgi:hypothetical protein